MRMNKQPSGYLLSPLNFKSWKQAHKPIKQAKKITQHNKAREQLSRSSLNSDKLSGLEWFSLLESIQNLLKLPASKTHFHFHSEIPGCFENFLKKRLFWKVFLKKVILRPNGSYFEEKEKSKPSPNGWLLWTDRCLKGQPWEKADTSRWQKARTNGGVGPHSPEHWETARCSPHLDFQFL